MLIARTCAKTCDSFTGLWCLCIGCGPNEQVTLSSGVLLSLVFCFWFLKWRLCLIRVQVIPNIRIEKLTRCHQTNHRTYCNRKLLSRVNHLKCTTTIFFQKHDLVLRKTRGNPRPNITMMPSFLAICSVHSNHQKSVEHAESTQPDWYGPRVLLIASWNRVGMIPSFFVPHTFAARRQQAVRKHLIELLLIYISGTSFSRKKELREHTVAVFRLTAVPTPTLFSLSSPPSEMSFHIRELAVAEQCFQYFERAVFSLSTSFWTLWPDFWQTALTKRTFSIESDFSCFSQYISASFGSQASSWTHPSFLADTMYSVSQVRASDFTDFGKLITLAKSLKCSGIDAIDPVNSIAKRLLAELDDENVKKWMGGAFSFRECRSSSL